MNWTNFQTYELGHEKAFESLCNQIFERWVREKYANDIVYFATVRGDGGDGGVEAFAELRDGSYIGVQSKWFPDGLSDKRIRQIEKSIRTAMSVRPQMRTYFVCIPFDLTSTKKVQGDKNATNTEETRWNDLKEKIKKDFSQLELILWDDHNLTTLLQRPDLEGALKFWFSKEIITFDLLKQHLSKAKVAWLRERYTPDLHSTGHINIASEILLRTVDAKEKIIGKMSELYEVSTKLVKELSTLQKVLNESSSPCFHTQTEYLIELNDYIVRSITSARNGNDIDIFDKKDPADNREFFDELDKLKESKARILSDDIKKLVEDFYKTNQQPPIEKLAAIWNRRFRLFAGDPGTGKTHALANSVEVALSTGYPAFIIQTKSIHDPSSWKTILQSSLGLGSDWSEGEILGALECRATISETNGKYQPDSDKQAGYFLICIDGLDETQDWEGWQNRIKEIETLTSSFPRLRFLVTARDYFFEKTELDKALKNYLKYLPPEGDVPVWQVFDKYIAKFEIDVSEVPWVKWSIRSLLVLRLFCDQYKGKRLGKADQISTTVGSLLRDRFQLIEKEFVSQIRPKTIGPDKFLLSLSKLAEHFMQHDEIQHDALVALLRSDLQLYEGYINTAVEYLKNHGLLVAFKKGAAGPLKPGETYYQPSFQPVIEFFIALQIVDLAIEGKGIPTHLKHQIGILRIATTILFIDHGILPEKEGPWGDLLSERTINELRCSALSSAPPDKTIPYIEWAKTELKTSMPKSRFILAHLCYPVCHIPSHPLGPKLVHEVLKDFKCSADRDLIWSGIDYVPENHGAPWEGRGSNPIRDSNYSLTFDDKFDSLPLLHAWNLTSVDNSILHSCSKNLVRWGTKQPTEMVKLLNQMLPSNDPQLEEYLLVAALGVVSLLKGSQGHDVGIFANWFLDNVFTQEGLKRYRSSIIRASGRAIVERAYELKVISDEKVKMARPPFNVEFEPLPLSVEAAKEKESHGPVWHDLAWYVIKNAYNGFFEHKREDNEASEEDKDIWVNEDEVNYLLSENLGKLTPEEKQRLERSLKNKQKLSRDWEAIQSNMAYQIDDPFKDEDSAEENVELKEVIAKLKVERAPDKYYPDAEEFLLKHGQILGFEITPHQLTLSAVCKFAENLGWNEEVFRGNLNGGNPGEILGADYAITRQHFMSSHGSRSTIMSFGEKYVWCAVHYLQGFFSDYVAFSDWDKRQPVTDYSMIEDFFNPAQPMPPKYGKQNMIAPCLLSPDEPSIQGDLPKAIQNWVKNAALPKLQEWIFPDPMFTKHMSGDKPLCLLHCFTSHTEVTGLGDSLLWIHAFLIENSDLEIFEQSLQPHNIFLSKLIKDPNSRMTTGVHCDCYISPRDVIFMSWKKEYEPLTSLQVLKDGNVSSIQMLKCVCEVTTSSGEGGERTFHLPTKVIRDGLGITRGDGILFEDENGNKLAFNAGAGEAFRNSQDNLYVDREQFINFLKKNNKTPVWLVRFDRRQSTKAFHSVQKIDPEIVYPQVYYFKDGQLKFFQFEREER